MSPDQSCLCGQLPACALSVPVAPAQPARLCPAPVAAGGRHQASVLVWLRSWFGRAWSCMQAEPFGGHRLYCGWQGRIEGTLGSLRAGLIC